MKELALIRKISLVVGAICFVSYLVILFSGSFIKVINYLLSSSLLIVLAISLTNSGGSAAIILELMATVISGESWPDKKYFRYFLPLWILLFAIQIAGILLSKTHLPIRSS
jgi:hypothetical protein